MQTHKINNHCSGIIIRRQLNATYRQRTAEHLANAIDEIYEHWRDNQP